jgi:hypothetical protein
LVFIATKNIALLLQTQVCITEKTFSKKVGVTYAVLCGTWKESRKKVVFLKYRDRFKKVFAKKVLANQN